MRARVGIWALVVVAVVLSTRTIAYALAPQSALLDALAHNQVGPDVTVPLIVAVLVGAVVACSCLCVAALAVRERLVLENRRLARAPRLRPWLLAARVVVLFAVSSFLFAMVESTIHWRDGLGWHGLHCLTGPVHRDAIPILAALSLVAVALHGAIEHLLEWARRLVVQLAARLPGADAPAYATSASSSPRRLRTPTAHGARGPPTAVSVSAHLV